MEDTMQPQQTGVEAYLADLRQRAESHRKHAAGYMGHADNLTVAAQDFRILARVNEQEAQNLEAQFPGLYDQIAGEKAQAAADTARAEARREAEEQAQIAESQQADIARFAGTLPENGQAGPPPTPSAPEDEPAH